MLLTDLIELKSILGIDFQNSNEDKNLNFYIEQASSWIEEYLDRPGGLGLATTTEYYGGTNTQTLRLRRRPVYVNPIPVVYLDESGYFGSASGAYTASNSQLNYGTDFCLQIDQPDGNSSRSGILIRIGNWWPRPLIRQGGLLSPYVGPSFGSIRVTYAAGFTIDNLPALIRAATNLLASRMRYLMPLGMEISSESYEDRSISLVAERKDYLMSIVKPMLVTFRNWTF